MGSHLHKVNINLKRAVAQQTKKLGFGFNLGGHQIYYYYPQRSYVLMYCAVFCHDKDIFGFKDSGGGKIVGNFDRHIGLPSVCFKDYGTADAFLAAGSMFQV
jgi:hypothetical protein